MEEVYENNPNKKRKQLEKCTDIEKCSHCKLSKRSLIQPFEYYYSYKVCTPCYSIVKLLTPTKLGLGPMFQSE